MIPTDPHELYALANRHATHRHMGDDLMAGRDWIPTAIECGRVAAALQADAMATYQENIRAGYALSILAA